MDRAIELSEDTLILQTAERDPLTDLYHPEFFFQYAHSFKTHHPDAVMDAIFLDISHFQLVNELYGKEYGNEVLIKLADRIRSLLSQHGGIACRKDADIFLIYCPHREDHLEKTLAYLQAAFPDREDSIRLRMGVCFGGRDDTDVRILFDHAHNARDSVKASRKGVFANLSLTPLLRPAAELTEILRGTAQGDAALFAEVEKKFAELKALAE